MAELGDPATRPGHGVGRNGDGNRFPPLQEIGCYPGENIQRRARTIQAMTLIFNLIGLGMLAAGFGIAFAVQFLSGGASDDVVLLIAAPLLFIADLAYRHRDSSGRGWWYSPKAGRTLCVHSDLDSGAVLDGPSGPSIYSRASRISYPRRACEPPPEWSLETSHRSHRISSPLLTTSSRHRDRADPTPEGLAPYAREVGAGELKRSPRSRSTRPHFASQ